MAKYMLVSFKTCPWVQRSAIILREKNTPFELRHIEPDNRPDWFLAISPHKKVPVLTVDDKVSLFESNAINEYLDETVEPRLHPADPVERARNRAWTDYVPSFASAVTGCAYAANEEAYKKALEQAPVAFERLEKALEANGAGPFFNGAKYSLVDAAYAPFLQRYFFLDRIKPIGQIERRQADREHQQKRVHVAGGMVEPGCEAPRPRVFSGQRVLHRGTSMLRPRRRPAGAYLS